MSFVGLQFAGMQAATALSEYQAAAQSGNAALIAEKRANLIDKTLGAVAAIGATVATIPTAPTKTAGLAIWALATGAQQVYNGNAAAALDYLSQEIKDMFHNLIGGPSIEFGQYIFNGTEFVSMEFRDDWGISQGEFGKTTGKAAEVWVEHPDGWMVYRTENGVETSRFVGQSKSVTDTRNIPQLAWQAALAEAQDQFEAGNTGIVSNGQGGSADFILDVLNFAGLDAFEMMAGLSFTGMTAQYLDLAEWFSHYGDIQWYTSQYPDPDAEADRRFASFEVLQFWTYEQYYNFKFSAKSVKEAVQSGIASPIVIDLNGDGVQTTGLFTSSTVFDLNGDGLSEKVGWIDKNDAFLAYDRNGNHEIDGIDELFGGTEVGIGYEKLGVFDTNQDGIVDAMDDDFGSLILWNDKNSDGKSTPEELMNLNSVGIAALNLNYAMSDFVQHGNIFGETSTAVWTDGRVTEMTDVYFRYGGPISPATTANP